MISHFCKFLESRAEGADYRFWHIGHALAVSMEESETCAHMESVFAQMNQLPHYNPRRSEGLYGVVGCVCACVR